MQRGKVPVVVGGTGLYLRWLVHGKPHTPRSTPQLAAKAQQKLSKVRSDLGNFGDWHVLCLSHDSTLFQQDETLTLPPQWHMPESRSKLLFVIYKQLKSVSSGTEPGAGVYHQVSGCSWKF